VCEGQRDVERVAGGKFVVGADPLDEPIKEGGEGGQVNDGYGDPNAAPNCPDRNKRGRCQGGNGKKADGAVHVSYS
jgi:hypothetical protein